MHLQLSPGGPWHRLWLGNLQPCWCHRAPCPRAQPCPASHQGRGAPRGCYLLGDVESSVPAALTADQQVLEERMVAARWVSAAGSTLPLGPQSLEQCPMSPGLSVGRAMQHHGPRANPSV